MAIFSDLTNELVGTVPGLNISQAGKYINRSYRDILDKRTWSFSVQEGAFSAPVLINAGTVGVTLNSPTVTCNALAAAALDAVALGVPVLTQRQFRVGTSGDIYNITAWASPNGPLTLDRPWLEATNPTSTYQVYQCYFPPPPISLVGSTGLYDFNRWLSILDPINGIKLSVDTNKARLDVRDPQRGVGNLAYAIYDYKADALGNPRWEFWPHPTGGQQFNCIYKVRGVAFTSGGQALPQMIPDSLVLSRAVYRYAAPWGQVNAGRLPQLQKVNWSAMINDARKEYLADLQAAVLNDENVFMQNLVRQGRRAGPPVDSSFMQSHDMTLYGR